MINSQRTAAARPAAAGGGTRPGHVSAAVAYAWTEGRFAEACAWCGHRFRGADEYRPGRIRCSRCGVATTSPWPTDEQLAAAYAMRKWTAPGRLAAIGDALLRRTFSALADRLHRMLRQGPVLDVGAGDGTLVRAFRQRGRAAVGVDPRVSGADPHVRAVEFQDMAGRWSAVIFWHTLGQLRQPVQALRHAAALLMPGGLLVIAVPNAASLQARLFGDRWLALDLPRHLVHISPPALLAQLQALGFRVERVSYLRGGQVLFGWLHGIVGWLPGHPDLYRAVRRGGAGQTPWHRVFRLYALAAAVAVLPLALAGTAVEVATRSGGTLYVEARRVPRRRPGGSQPSR